MTHDEFRKLASDAAGNAQGLRPLARHVRALYRVIRELQQEDNSFFYIAEIIQQARNDKTEAVDFVARVKTYHHRDRRAAGDAPVKRGMVQLRSPGEPHVTTALSSASSSNLHPSDPSRLTIAIEPPRPSDSAASNGSAGAIVAPSFEDDEPRPPGGELTAALHGRLGRRRVVRGG